MPKSLAKVQKHITKKKGKNASALHANSRDSQRLQRAAARDDRLSRLLSSRQKQNIPYLLRLDYIQKAATDRQDANSTNTTYQLPEIHELIQQYLARDDEELARLKAERRPGRPPSKREQEIEQRKAEEEKEYVSGFWLPDLEDAANVVMLRGWDGEWVSLNTLNFVRIQKGGAKHVSTFPPKGQS